MALVGTKVVVLLLLGVIKLSAGLLPLLLTKVLKRKGKCLKKFIGIILCFGGGVLVSTIFIHMLREVSESLQRAASLGSLPADSEYPFPELLVLLGFLLILLLESLAAKLLGTPGGHGHSHGLSHGHSHGQTNGHIGHNHSHDHERGYGLTHNKTISKKEAKLTIQDDHLKVPADNPAFTHELSDSATKPSAPDHKPCASVTLMSYNSVPAPLPPVSLPPHSTAKPRRRVSPLTYIRSSLVILALSIHSLFEGMAIGLEESDSGVWKLFLAVSLHAVAISFCIGTEMSTTGLRKRSIIIYISVLR